MYSRIRPRAENVSSACVTDVKQVSVTSVLFFKRSKQNWERGKYLPVQSFCRVWSFVEVMYMIPCPTGRKMPTGRPRQSRCRTCCEYFARVLRVSCAGAALWLAVVGGRHLGCRKICCDLRVW